MNQGRALHPLFLCAAGFMILAPLSSTTLLSLATPVKSMRLGVTLIMVTIAITSWRAMQKYPAASALGGFVFLFVAGAVWSDLPHWGLFHKGMFALTCFAGLAIAPAMRDIEQLRHGLRFLGLVSAIASAVVVAVYVFAPAASTVNNRLSLYGINANTIGQTAAPMFILCVYIAFYEMNAWWRSCGYLGCVTLGMVILGTGSRGALMLAVVGVTIAALPLTRRPILLLTTGSLLTLAAFIMTMVIDVPGVERVGEEFTKDTRGGIWGFGLNRFAESPLIGHGWLHWGDRWGSVQNAYIQTLVETGLLGGALLLRFLYTVAGQTRRMLKKFGRQRDADIAYFAAAMTIAMLVHGMAESSIFFGTSLNAFMLGLGVGLIDRLPVLRTQTVISDALANARRVAVATMPCRISPLTPSNFNLMR